jgi:hypothetical protein
VLRGRREVDDRVDPIGSDTEFEGQLHIAAAKSVDEGVELASGCGSDPFGNSFPIGDRNHIVVVEPGVVRGAGDGANEDTHVV